jgi:transcriptional regulator with XRE-family HTH domain
MPIPHKEKPQLPVSLRTLVSLNVLRFRTERGWTQEELAYEAGLHRTYISQVEKGTRNVSIDTIECIVAALEIDVRELFVARES